MPRLPVVERFPLFMDSYGIVGVTQAGIIGKPLGIVEFDGNDGVEIAIDQYSAINTQTALMDTHREPYHILVEHASAIGVGALGT